MKALAIAIVACSARLLIYCYAGLSPTGEIRSAPASLHVSPRYIERTLQETSVPNIVTAVLADYRGYDTMFETIVIFTAGVACIALLRVFGAGARRDRGCTATCRPASRCGSRKAHGSRRRAASSSASTWSGCLTTW